MDSQLFKKCIERVEFDVKSALSECEPHPHISIGGSKTQQPFEVLVREIVTDMDVSDVVTSRYMGGASVGGYEVEFSVGIEGWASTGDLFRSSSTAMEWFARIASAIARDKTLGGLCAHAQPFLSTTGTAPANNKYMAAFEGGVRIKAEIDPIAEFGDK